MIKYLPYVSYYFCLFKRFSQLLIAQKYDKIAVFIDFSALLFNKKGESYNNNSEKLRL